tara:strand:+ start:335 stop:574 length:240 start_codon:yes stop_codon:yes gene_type:complete
MLKKICFLFLAIICFIIGVLGLILPIIPGIVFLIISLLCLSVASKRVHLFLQRLRKKYPALDKAWHLVEQKIKNIFRKV